MNSHILFFLMLIIVFIIYYESNILNNCNENYSNANNTNNVDEEDTCIEIDTLPYKFELQYLTDKSDMTTGLSLRDQPLKKSILYQGMMFDYGDNNNTRVMTMKDTVIPLDMIFVDENSKIVGIIEDAVPNSTNIYTVDEKCRYVIELNAGTVKNTKLKVGDKIADNKVIEIEQLS